MRIEGTKRLKTKLHKLVAESNPNLKIEIEQMLAFVAQEMRQAAPEDFGDMKESISFKVNKYGTQAVIGPGAIMASYSKKKYGSAFATTKRDTARTAAGYAVKKTPKKEDLLWQYFKAYWIEFGTKGHTITPVKTLGKKILTDGDGKYFGKKVVMPARMPRPFIMPSWDANKDDVKRAVSFAYVHAIKSAKGASVLSNSRYQNG